MEKQTCASHVMCSVSQRWASPQWVDGSAKQAVHSCVLACNATKRQRLHSTVDLSFSLAAAQMTRVPIPSGSSKARMQSFFPGAEPCTQSPRLCAASAWAFSDVIFQASLNLRCLMWLCNRAKLAFVRRSLHVYMVERAST